MAEGNVTYQYPPAFGIDNSLQVSCGAEGFSVSGHSNEVPFDELEKKIMNIVEKVAGHMKVEPKNYHG